MKLPLQRCSRRVAVAAALLLTGGAAQAALQVVACEGLGGEQVYTGQFDAQVAAVKHAAASLTDAQHVQVLAGRACTREAFAALLKQLSGALVAEDFCNCALRTIRSSIFFSMSVNAASSAFGALVAAAASVVKRARSCCGRTLRVRSSRLVRA